MPIFILKFPRTGGRVTRARAVPDRPERLSARGTVNRGYGTRRAPGDWTACGPRPLIMSAVGWDAGPVVT